MLSLNCKNVQHVKIYLLCNFEVNPITHLELLPFLAHLAFRPCELLPSLLVCPSTFHILIFTSETTGPIATKLWWNGPWMVPFPNCVRWSRFPTNMAAKQKIEKRGDEILIVHCCFSVSQNELKFNCSYMASIFRVFLWNFSFSRYIPIMQIRHILIKDHI